MIRVVIVDDDGPGIPIKLRDEVFKPWVMREVNGVPVAIIGQAFPYTPIANPRYMVADWSFGIQDENLQKMVDEARGKGAQVVVVLSHNGMDVDLKMASRVRGVDAILGGHTHDGMPVPVLVKNAGGTTIVTNAGSNGKFLGVLDLDVKDGKLADLRYTLLPVFSQLLPADPVQRAIVNERWPGADGRRESPRQQRGGGGGLRGRLCRGPMTPGGPR